MANRNVRTDNAHFAGIIQYNQNRTVAMTNKWC